MPYNSVTAARYLLAVAYNKGIILNLAKVQKLLYIAYGYFLSGFDKVLLDEKPKAWPHGPVFPKTVKKVKAREAIDLNDEELTQISQDRKLKETLEKIIDKYAPFTSSQLSDRSHSEGGAWHKTTRLKGFRWNNPIPDAFVKDCFSRIKI